MSSKRKSGVSRRGFIATMGAGVVGAAVSGQAESAAAAAAETGASITLNVNGREHRLDVEPRWTLLYVLRDRLGLTGTKPGCERGECGACTVLLDGQARYACLTLAIEAQGRQITTVEGLLDGEKLGPVQQAFVEKDGMQCGFCTPGQVMAAEALLRRNPQPDVEQIREGMSGNLCRCGSYVQIVRSVQRAAELRRASGGGHE